jgi:hypothetical protein
MRRYKLSDAQWDQIQDLSPAAIPLVERTGFCSTPFSGFCTRVQPDVTYPSAMALGKPRMIDFASGNKRICSI